VSLAVVARTGCGTTCTDEVALVLAYAAYVVVSLARTGSSRLLEPLTRGVEPATMRAATGKEFR
jgi:hypothetical protein